jgi:hypothetical protein
LPASSALQRLASEQRERTRHQVYIRMLALLPTDMLPRLDALLHVEEGAVSVLQVLKEPPDTPTPRAVLHLTDKLDGITQTGMLALELSWLNNNLQKVLTRQAQGNRIIISLNLRR